MMVTRSMIQKMSKMELLVREIRCLTKWLEWDYNPNTVAIMLLLMMELDELLKGIKSPQLKEKIGNWMDDKITLWEQLVYKAPNLPLFVN